MSSAKAGLDKVELFSIFVHTRESSQIEKRLEVEDVFGHTDRSRNRFTQKQRTQRSQTGAPGNIHAISNTSLAKEHNSNIFTMTNLIITEIVHTSPIVCKNDENQSDRVRKVHIAMRNNRLKSQTREGRALIGPLVKRKLSLEKDGME